MADELKSRGAPDCLIQVKDKNYHDNHVLANNQAFLKFFVHGAVAYYENNKHFSIPVSMQKTAILLKRLLTRRTHWLHLSEKDSCLLLTS